MSCRHLALALGSMFAATARADVIVVDSTGSGDFIQINLAVSAAVDGDLVLVKSGSYNAFLIPDRAVSVVADEGALVTITGYVAVLDLKAGATVLLSGLHATALDDVAPALYVVNNQGTVRIQDSSFRGYTPDDMPFDGFSPMPPGGEGAWIHDSRDVALVNTSIIGGEGGTAENYAFCLCVSGRGGDAMQVVHSRVSFFNATIQGGNGGMASYAGGGGHGLDASDHSRLFVSGAIVRGGDGGFIQDIIPICEPGGDGVVLDATSRARILDTVVEGGPQAGPTFFDCDPGVPFSGAGTVVQIPGIARRVELQTVMREQSSVGVTFRGESQDLVNLPQAASSGYRNAMLPFVGKWLIFFPPLWSVAPLGVTDATGNFFTTHHAGPVTVRDHHILHTQGVFRSTIGLFMIANPRMLVVLDSQF